MSKDKNNNWLQFEKDVLEHFQLVGYKATHDAQIQGHQTDVIAETDSRDRPNLLIECKHHSSKSHKVGNTDVTKFVARVTTLRMQGVIDQGYLVTNTGFTAPAQACVRGNPAENFVFLTTFSELQDQLIDFRPYLRNYIDKYEKELCLDHMVDLSVVDGGFMESPRFGLSAEQILVKSSEEGHLANLQICLLPIQMVALKQDKVMFKRGIRNTFTLSLSDFLQDKSDDSRSRRKNWSDEENKRAASLNVPEISKLPYLLSMDKKSLLGQKLGSLPLVPSIWEKFSKKRKEWVIHVDYLKKLKKIEPMFRLLDEEIEIRTGNRRQPKTIAYSKLFCSKIKTTIQELEARDQFVPPDSQIAILPFLGCMDRMATFLSSPTAQMQVIIGDYGAGKTTIVRHMMYLLSKEILNGSSKKGNRIPLLISLRDYNKVADFKALLTHFLMTEVGAPASAIPFFDMLNRKGRFIIILDGFDEMLSRVTPQLRRITFTEMSGILNSHSKVILTGRPGYFPESDEFYQLVESVMQKAGSAGSRKGMRASESVWIDCLQLMDPLQLNSYFLERAKLVDDDKFFDKVQSILRRSKDLWDLARRPVLADIISDSVDEIGQNVEDVMNVRDLFDVYTDRWVKREEEKGKFRLLIEPEQKEAFVIMLASQMHATGELNIHWRGLDASVSKYFGLEKAEEIDHFSHDIRTCSFLAHSESGFYSFIHKSFMEYFVARGLESNQLKLLSRIPCRPIESAISKFIKWDQVFPEVKAALGLQTIRVDQWMSILGGFTNSKSLMRTLQEIGKVLKNQEVEGLSIIEAAEKYINSIKAIQERHDIDVESLIALMVKEGNETIKALGHALRKCIGVE